MQERIEIAPADEDDVSSFESWDYVSGVLDSSAIIKYVARERDWTRVERYFATGDTIELAFKETANALWKKVSKKELELETAKKIVLSLPKTIWLLDQSKYIGKALEIAVNHTITVYDSLFIACALIEDAKLISCDKRQLEVASLLEVNTALV